MWWWCGRGCGRGEHRPHQYHNATITSTDVQRVDGGKDIIFDSDDHDIDYYYASRLSGETAPETDDIHYHVLEPRTVRVSASYKF